MEGLAPSRRVFGLRAGTDRATGQAVRQRRRRGAGVDALRERSESEWLNGLRREAANAFAAFDLGEGFDATADQLMDGIDQELGLRP